MTAARSKIIIILSLALLLLGRCATTRRYESYVDQWRGKTSGELVKDWGPPADIKTLADHTRVYSYVRRTNPDYANKTSRTMASTPVSCTTSFIIDEQDYVTGWTLDGYDCRTK